MLAAQLRAAGVRVDLAYGDRGMKGAMRAADRSGASIALVAGDRDIEAGTIGVKDLSTGEQVDVAADAVRRPRCFRGLGRDLVLTALRVAVRRRGQDLVDVADSAVEWIAALENLCPAGRECDEFR